MVSWAGPHSASPCQEPNMRISLALVAAAIACCAQPNPKLFDYDATQPLEYIEELAKTLENGVRVLDCSYASPRGGRVPCYLVEPKRKGKFAGIVWQHGGSQNRQWFLADAISLAEVGAVSILLDSPWERPKDWRHKFPGDEAEQMRDETAQVGVDVRRAIDVLCARENVDPERIGYTGLSFGAMIGGSL